VEQAINLWVFPLENELIISCYCISYSCVLMFVDAVHYSYGTNGKACAEKYKDIANKQGY